MKAQIFGVALFGFVLPVATPPNAIVYGAGAVSGRQMLKAGALLDVISIAIVLAAAELPGSTLSMPSWSADCLGKSA